MEIVVFRVLSKYRFSERLVRRVARKELTAV